MDTFKGQDNDVTANLCGDNNYAIVKVPHNLTINFSPQTLPLINLLNILSVKSTTNGLQLNKGKNSTVSM